MSENERNSSPARLRVVSLVPSLTETLLAWGIVPVAVSRFCAVDDRLAIPRVGGTKDPNIQKIVQLDPDLVLLCKEENRLEDANALVEAGVDIHVTEVHSLGDVIPNLKALAERLGVSSWEQERSKLDEAVEMLSTTEVLRKKYRAFVPIWRRPWMTLNNNTYGSSVLAALGVVNTFGNSSEPYPVVDLDQARDTHPDLVIAPSEPYPFSSKHLTELDKVAPVLFVDGKDLFWWGSRTASALMRLAKSLSNYTHGQHQG